MKKQPPQTYQPEPPKFPPAQFKMPPNPILPVLWSDTLDVQYDQQNALLRFSATVEGHKIEVARVQTSLDHVKKMVDMFCNALNYYPTKPE